MIYRSGNPKHSFGFGLDEVPEGTLIDVDLSHVWWNSFYDYTCVSFDKSGKSTDPTKNRTPWVRFDRERFLDFSEFFNAL